MKLETVIQRCMQNDRKAQYLLYDRYAPVLLSICLRYVKKMEVAEDMLVQSFYKIFDRMDSYEGTGSFEGWMKRIVINECLMELRKTRNFALTIPVSEAVDEVFVEISQQLDYHEVLRLLDQLPDGYRTVFNLYVLEGYKHREIAEMLGISINTSKSQLILARKKLQKLIKKNLRIKHG